MDLLDIVMLIAFVLFMVFVFGGYHKSKFEQRQKDEEKNKNF